MFTLIVGIIAIFVLVVLQIIYFRRSIFIIAIPVMIVLTTAFSIIERRYIFMWPIIAFSVS